MSLDPESSAGAARPRARSVRLGASATRDVGIALAFYAGYLLLDWVSYIHPMQTLSITPWNPHPALAIAVLAVRGQGWLPVVFGAVFLAEILVRGATFPWVSALILSCVLTLGYAAMARALVSPFPVRRSLDEGRDVVRLIVVVILGALLTASLYVGALVAMGARLDEGLAIATLKFWIGDSVGILGTLPLLFLLIEPARREVITRFFSRVESILQAVAIGAALGVVFVVFGGEPFKYFYLLFLPLIWVAARDGLPGAVLALALIQCGIIVAVQVGGAPTVTVFELQALQMALTITGLFLGVTVDERERAARALRQSTRLAAAGSMAAALAHELNQPLTALAGYAKASQLLAAAQPLDAARLDDTLRRLVAEAHRAADVVQRVREFFQTGAPQRAPADLVAIARAVIESLQPRAARAGVTIELDAQSVQALSLDRIQIEVVLRNLLLNGIEAAAENNARPAWVRVSIVQERGTVQVTVQDSGRGVAAGSAERIFEPFVTSKASGMGMGLPISRAIVQAHGGTLAAVTGDKGMFVLRFPLPRA